jgi:hypothetical protein
MNLKKPFQKDQFLLQYSLLNKSSYSTQVESLQVRHASKMTGTMLFLPLDMEKRMIKNISSLKLLVN